MQSRILEVTSLAASASRGALWAIGDSDCAMIVQLRAYLDVNVWARLLLAASSPNVGQ
jgi:hypothetical protein